MFGLSFTKSDAIRAAWSFIFGVVTYAAVSQGVPNDWKAFATGAVMAGLSALKNFVLADTSRIKG